MAKNTILRKGFIVAILFGLISVSVIPNSFGKIGEKRLRSDSPDIPPKAEWNRLFTTHEFYESTWVEQTKEGGYIILGSASHNIWLIKTDRTGHEQWNRTFQGNEPVIGHTVHQTKDGGYILIGGTVTIHGQYNNSLLIKTDDEGNEQWSKIFGGPQRDLFLSGQQTNDSGYILVGDTDSFGSKDVSRIWLLKTDETGNKQWNKTYGNGSGNSIQQTTDAGYIIAGTTHGNMTRSDMFLLKTDFYGNEAWKKTYGSPYSDLGHSAQQTSDGGFIIFGISYQGEMGNVPAVSLLIKTDSQGNEVWNKTFRKGENDDIQGYTVRQTKDQGYIMTGTLASFSIPGWYNLWLLRTDTNGNIVWERTFDSGDEYGDRGKVVQQTADGGYIVAGDSAEEAIWLIKIAAESPVKNTFILGRISASTISENYSILHASRAFCFQLFPLKIQYFHSGEEIIVSNDYNGTLTNTTIFGVFKAHI
jgi:hypothetical protein